MWRQLLSAVAGPPESNALQNCLKPNVEVAGSAQECHQPAPIRRPKKNGGDASQTPLFRWWLHSEQEATPDNQILGYERLGACCFSSR